LIHQISTLVQSSIPRVRAEARKNKEYRKEKEPLAPLDCLI
jgi:hypothetical protein